MVHLGPTGQTAFPFSGGAVRGVEVDVHGRVIVTGGGDTGPGMLKVFDPVYFVFALPGIL